jgi:hypothetical protein
LRSLIICHIKRQPNRPWHLRHPSRAALLQKSRAGWQS